MMSCFVKRAISAKVCRPCSIALIGLFTSVQLISPIWADVSWLGWLGGSSRNGWVEDFHPPANWPDELQQTWQITVGTGYGSPLVADGLIYQHARQGEEEVVWCVELETGAVKWRKSDEVPFKMGGGGEWHGKGPKACPALSAGRLFTMSITGVLTARDAESGDQLWQRDYSSRFKSGHPYWGASTSPLVDDQRVVVRFGNDDEGVLVALDVLTGKEVWSHGKEGASYSSPLLVEIAGVRQIVEWNHETLIGVESKSGRLLWEYPFPHVSHNQNMPTPTFHNGTILIGGENRGIHGLKPEPTNESWSVNHLWHQDKVALDMSSTIVNEGHLFGFSHYGKGRLFCLDMQSGDIHWQSPGRMGQNATFLAFPGHVVTLLDNGSLQVVAADHERFAKLASYQVSDQPTWAPPVLLKDGLLVKDKQTLTRWAFPTVK